MRERAYLDERNGLSLSEKQCVAIRETAFLLKRAIKTKSK